MSNSRARVQEKSEGKKQPGRDSNPCLIQNHTKESEERSANQNQKNTKKIQKLPNVSFI